MPSQQTSVARGPDRQRILNVLAQRRYRQRKRERLQFLETRLGARLDTSSATYASGRNIPLDRPIQPPPLEPPNPGAPNRLLCDPNLGFMIGASDASVMCLASPESEWSGVSNNWANTNQVEFNTSERPSSYMRDQFPINTPLYYGSASQSGPQTSDSHLSAELQDLETSQFTFPSENAIDIPIYKTTQISFHIAHMLGCANGLLDMTTSQILDVSKISIPLGDVPENLWPTEAQLTLPHHPVLDLLPWPSVRTRLICFFSQPDHLRPPVGEGSMAIMKLVHDFEDESEGVRITSEINRPGHDGKSWEIGQAILKDWWWALDPEIVSNSNRLRYLRGASKLQLPAP